MFDSMIRQARGVAVAGLSRVELAGVVEGAGQVIAAMTSLQARCAVEIEGLGDDGVSSKTVLREAGRMSTRAASSVAKTAAGSRRCRSWLSRWRPVLSLGSMRLWRWLPRLRLLLKL